MQQGRSNQANKPFINLSLTLGRPPVDAPRSNVRVSPRIAPKSASGVLICFSLFVQCAVAQMIDLNGNGMSDVWEQIYGAGGLAPNEDADADGASNLQEAIAGTNPFDSQSYPHVGQGFYSSSNFSVTVSCALGKQYQMQSAASLGSRSWLVEATVIARSGTNLTLIGGVGSAPKFYRIVISDVNSDGLGQMNDWEKYQLGLDPMNPYSNRNLDPNGQLLPDYAYATNKLASQNVMALSAPGPITTQPDPGSGPGNPGVLTLTRGGFPFLPVTVTLGLGGPGPGFATEGVDYLRVPRSVTLPAGVSSTNLTITPLANTNLHAPAIAQVKLLPGLGYGIGQVNNANVVIYPSATANGTGLSGSYYTNSSDTYSDPANFSPTNLVFSRLDSTVDFDWTNNVLPFPNDGFYSIRWSGQVQPQFSELYYFDVYSSDGCRLWVNDQLIIDNWTTQGSSDSLGSIALQAGVRYNLKLEYFQFNDGSEVHLNWYSASQPEQIVPVNRLYPVNGSGSGGSTAPAAITSALNAFAFVNQPFSFPVTAANTPLSYTASGLPPGLSFNPATGLISGTPTVGGNYPVALTASNGFGVGASVLNLQVIDPGSAVVREIWTNVPGTNITDIPTGTPANLTNILATLEGTTNLGSNYAERIRGYLTAPATGNYYFWIAASDAAELWISNDGEPVNKLKRASVQPRDGGSGFHQWNAQPTQQSRWLTLVAGRKYYIEILHKAGKTAPAHWSVGWLQDWTGTNSLPAGVVPGFVLSRYYPLPTTIMPGTLFSANLLAQNGVASSAVGSATLQLSADGTQAILRASYSGLSSPRTGQHIHCDPYLNSPSQIIFDVDEATPRPDGSYLWTIGPVGTFSAADIVEIIREGKAYLNVHSVNYPAGEINGHFTLARGSQAFTPPPAPPAWTDDHASTNAVVRFLTQATFGPSLTDIAAVRSQGYTNWLLNQFALPASHHLPLVMANISTNQDQPFPSYLTFNAWWQQSLTAPDQLRQRVAFALSEILVVSEQGPLSDSYANGLSSYYDTLLDHAFGNFRDLLKAVTLHPAMGVYLNMQGNDIGNIVTGLHPDENYAREINQLFSIGLYRMWPDGTLVLNSQNSLVPTYNQDVISGFARVFTGWNFFQTNDPGGRLPSNWYPDENYTNAMVLVPTHHELGTKLVLDNVMLPAAQGPAADPTQTNFDSYCAADLEQALDSIFNNPNVGPFICRQLIQRLVTSSPSREYVYRVVQKFNDDGTGARGNLRAVVSAILLDYEARSATAANAGTFGKLREPLLRVTSVVRAFPAGVTNSWDMEYTDQDDTYNLSQTPLRSPTVFNFFYPGYQFPGTLASAGLTTPEFQLTSDTGVALQMNFVTSGILDGSGNTNGLSSFVNGSGAINVDLGPWMDAKYTADANVPALVDSLSILLLAGQLSPAAKTNIVNYVIGNFDSTDSTWQLDRVAGVVQLIINSPDFLIQN